MRDIRHIATSFKGERIAIAEFEKNVQIFDIEKQAVISNFETILDFGGKRMAIDESGKYCVCGSWSKFGLTAYDTENGNQIWQRKDLKKTQGIQLLRSNHEVFFVQFESQISRLLDFHSGKDIKLLNRVVNYFESKYESFDVLEKEKEIEMVARKTSSQVYKIDKKSFFTLDIAHGSNSFLISESAAPLSCYDSKTGRLKWRVPLGQDGHFLRLSFSDKLSKYVGVSSPYLGTGNKKLKYIHPETGNIDHEMNIGGGATVTEFAFEGEILVTSDSMLINIETGEVVSWNKNE